MYKAKKKLFYFVNSIVFLVFGVATMIVATVLAFNFGNGVKYINELTIASIKKGEVAADGDTTYIVTLNGELKNNSSAEFKSINVILEFGGKIEDTQKSDVYLADVVIEDFNSKANVDLSGKTITIISSNGFVPESLSRVLIMDGTDMGEEAIILGDNTTAIVLFGVSILELFLATMFFAFFENIKKSIEAENAVKKEN